MAEFQSILRAARTKDGGARAILSIVTKAGPVNINAVVPPSDAEKLRAHFYEALASGSSQPGKVARMKLERGDEPIYPKSLAPVAPAKRAAAYYETSPSDEPARPSMEGIYPISDKEPYFPNLMTRGAPHWGHFSSRGLVSFLTKLSLNLQSG